MNLIVRLHPYSDESLHGFLRRVSEKNMAPNVKVFLASFGVKYRLVFNEAELAQLARVLCVDVADLVGLQLNPASHTLMLRPKYQSCEGGKVCPLCIAETPYQRVGWGHVLMTACPLHDIQLVSKCAVCGLTVNAACQLDRCACGQPYAAGSTNRACNESLALCALMLGIEHPARHSLPLPWRTGQPPTDLVDLLCLLGKQFKDTNRPRGKVSADDVITQAQAGFALLLHWPMRFDEALAVRLASTEGPGLAKRLGGWYRALHTRFVDPVYDCIREALVRHLSVNFDGHLNLRLSTIDPQHLKDKCWLSSEEAGRLIGIGSELVRSAVTTGDIPGKVVVKGKNRFVSIHKDVVEKVRQDRLRYLTTTDVRRRLGVSKLVFERLMQSGALDKKTKGQRPPMVSAEFRVADVDALVTRLKKGVHPRDVDRSAWMGLQDVSVKRGIPDANICQVLQKILHQEILPIAVIDGVPGIAGLRFDQAEIKACFEEEQREPTLSLAQLADMRGWKHESILAWIKMGALKAEKEQRGNRLITVIPVSALMDFMSRYLVLADAASRVNSKSNWILRGLMPAGVSAAGAAALPGGGQRGVLLEIDAVLGAAQLNKRRPPSVQREVANA